MQCWGHVSTRTNINGVTRGLEEAVTSEFIFSDYKSFGKLMFGRVIGQSVNNKASMWERGLVAV